MAWVDGRLVLRSALVAFRYVEGEHSGANLAKIMQDILANLDCLGRIGTITLDNASNNNTLMESMEENLTALGIAFSKDENRIR
jgi:hypothetical protein